MRTQPFRQIARELEKRIRNGVYPVDSALPSRLELTREFDVARATLDRAIGELVDSGILVSRHGSGTFVAPPRQQKYRVIQIGGGDYFNEYSDSFDLTLLPQAELVQRSEWRRLLEYDGILWVRPEAVLFPAIEAVGNQLPQVLVNRVVADLPYVSTDHRGAYREITASRLAEMPDATPVFLQSERNSLVTAYRRDGFIDACREAGRFYDLLVTPSSFEERLRMFNERLRYDPGKRLIVVGDSLVQTGTLMRWGSEHHVRWGVDLFYSDFDNDYPADVWGVTVTSYLQDHTALYQEAAAKLRRLIEGASENEPGKLVFPQFRRGDT